MTFDQYKAFQTFLRDNYNDMLAECETKGLLTRKYLKKMLDKFSKTQGASMSDEQLEIFIKVLDFDRKP